MVGCFTLGSNCFHHLRSSQLRNHLHDIFVPRRWIECRLRFNQIICTVLLLNVLYVLISFLKIYTKKKIFLSLCHRNGKKVALKQLSLGYGEFPYHFFLSFRIYFMTQNLRRLFFFFKRTNAKAKQRQK